MSKLKPIQVNLQSGLIVGLILLVIAVIGIIGQWKDFYEFVAPNQVLLNWRFVIIIIGFSILLTWFIMNRFWQNEYIQHEITKNDRDNLRDKLRDSENQRLTDVITGIPNSSSLKRDISDHFSTLKRNQQLQFILIDLKGFGKINKEFGMIKASRLLRTIAQSIYQGMRRNEDMYKHALETLKSKQKKGFYRVFPGGDEFVFIIKGDQADAIGFSNRLVVQFEEISKNTEQILGKNIDLSFHCAIVELDHRDSYDDIFIKADDCYRISKEGKARFTICWHPNNKQAILSRNERKKFDYEKAHKIFDVMTISDKED